MHLHAISFRVSIWYRRSCESEEIVLIFEKSQNAVPVHFVLSLAEIDRIPLQRDHLTAERLEKGGTCANVPFLDQRRMNVQILLALGNLQEIGLLL